MLSVRFKAIKLFLIWSEQKRHLPCNIFYGPWGLSNLGSDTRDRITLLWGSWPGPCRRHSGILGLYPLDASSAHSGWDPRGHLQFINLHFRGTEVAHLVMRPTPDLSSDHDPAVHGIGPCIGLCDDRAELTWDTLSQKKNKERKKQPFTFNV